ncbi:hypothetical protein C8R45DRAFT_1036758 [Mycena sanguinolenta]|nr:hypothetical protein C8R45DRAFT_1036758 [Mycena sanguinolenta]
MIVQAALLSALFTSICDATLDPRSCSPQNFDRQGGRLKVEHFLPIFGFTWVGTASSSSIAASWWQSRTPRLFLSVNDWGRRRTKQNQTRSQKRMPRGQRI